MFSKPPLFVYIEKHYKCFDLSLTTQVSHPAAKYVKGRSCEYLHYDDHYQETDELVHEETEWAVLEFSHEPIV